MAYRTVADDVDERGLAGPQGTFQARSKLLRPLNVFTVTIHELKHPVVALVRQYLERIGPTFQKWHFVEARSPGTIVPQNRDDREPIAARSFEIEAADAKATVPDYKNDLFSGPGKLRTNRHADAVANGCERACVENLPGKASVEPLRHPAAHRKAIDHDRCVRIDHFTKLTRDPCWMDWCVVVVFKLLFDDYPIKVGPYLGDFLEPVRLAFSFPAAGTHCLAKLLENEFRVADQGNLCRHMETDPRRRGVSLNVACGFTPRGRLTELFAAPESKAYRQHRVGAPGERLFPWTSDCEWMVFRHRALPGSLSLAERRSV
jgi:hypothetical protein